MPDCEVGMDGATKMNAQDADRIDRWREHRERGDLQRRSVISVQRAADVLLWVLASAALLRGTQMWYGYPSSQAENETISPVNMQIMLYALAPFTLLIIAMTGGAALRRLHTTSAALIGSVAFIIISVVTSTDIVASLRGITATLLISAPLLIFAWRFGSVESIRLLRNFAVAAVIINIVYAVVFPHYGFMSGSLEGTMRGMFSHKNLFGQAMAVYFIALLPSPYERPFLRWPFILRMFACLGAIGCIVAARSSTAIVQAGVGVIFLLFSAGVSTIPARSLRSKIIVVALMLLVAILFFGGLVVASSVAAGLGKDLTLSGRSDVWAALIPHIFDRPFTGYGFAVMRGGDLVSQFTSNLNWGVRSTHNSYIELLLNIGIPGGIAWIAFLLGRVFSKLTTVPSDPAMRVARNRQVAIMLMILFGAITEAGQMLAPLAMWTILVLMLPLDRIKRDQAESRF